MAIETDRRREEIIRLVQTQGKVRVTDLSKQFGISEVSIRNDLELLEADGHLRRIHGGAVGKLYVNMSLNERYSTNSDAKKALAEKVVTLIDDNDTVMMNAGTTLIYILHELALRGKSNISIVTNSIQNAIEANAFASYNVTLLGGQLDAKYQFTYGQDTVNQLDSYHATKCLISFDGVSADHGLTLYYPNETPVIRKMMENSDLVIVAADKSKIGENAFSKVADASYMDVLVTNDSDRNDSIEEIKKLGTQVYEV